MSKLPAFIFILALVAIFPLSAHAQDIAANVFEVVVAKPIQDPLSYQEALPLELIPFMERNDPCYSIGTAFAIGGGRFVTAAHVLSPDQRSLYTGFGLRDSSGKVYPIGTVLAYSNRRDFMIFEVPGLSAPGLKLAPAYQLNTSVRTVGNALGEGIIIREGTLTSATPEDQDGEWRWLRFSAAASPGNSGGPLLDKDGQVIGIVTMKSQNENLNYALPVAEIDFRPRAIFSLVYRYVLPNLVKDNLNKDQLVIDLPMDFAAFHQSLMTQANEKMLQAGQRLALADPDARFPRAEKALSLLDNPVYSAMPQIISEKSDGTWFLKGADKTENGVIGKDGHLYWGDLWSYSIFDLHKPGDQSLATLFGNDQQLMDSILQAYGISRTVGTKAIRVSSLGKASDKTWFTDRWGRRWMLASWVIPIGNMRQMIMALPGPDGASGLLIRVPEYDVASISLDMRFLADFFNSSYTGTVAQWREFLAQPDFLPQSMREWQISGEPGKSISLHTSRFDLRVDPSIMPWKDNGLIYALPAFSRVGQDFAWDLGRLYIAGTLANTNAIDLTRHRKPSAEAGDSALSDWAKLTGESFPYNASPYSDKTDKAIRGTIFATPDGSVPEKPSLAWSLILANAEGMSDKDIKANLIKLRAEIKLAPREASDSPGAKASLIKPQLAERIEGLTLAEAIAQDKPELVSAFLKRTTDLKYRDADGRTALALAVRNGREAIVAQLLEAGAAVDATDQYGENLLHQAVRSGSAGLASQMLSRKLPLEQADYLGYTPLLRSITLGKPDLARLLIQAGANCRAVDKSGKNALCLALEAKLDDLVGLLLERGAAIDGHDEAGWSVLMYALRYGSDASLALIQSRRPDLRVKTSEGWTALHVAARYGRSTAIGSLVAGGLDPQDQTLAGRSALALAKESGSAETIKLLGESKASPGR